MGYRSDVTIVVEEKDFIRMLDEIKNNDEARSLLKEATLLKHENLISMNWEQVKWYPSYKDVNFFTNFKASCENSYTLEIGEDYDDCTVEMCGHNYEMYNMAYIRREIDLAGEEVSAEEIVNNIK